MRDVTVIGAGPYGLAAVAHLRATGLDVAAFGKPMSFWQERMPAGMLLRSSWSASHIAHPDGAMTLDEYEQSLGTHLARPIERASFVDYGRWYQVQVVPDLDQRSVRSLSRQDHGFALELEDNDVVQSRRVVLATGIGSFAWRPPQSRDVPPQFVSHSSDHRDFEAMSGKRVLVVGAGQSALETAALLHEHGAEVEVVARAPQIHWITRRDRLQKYAGPFWRLLYPPTDVGPPGLNLIVASPSLFRRLPSGLRRRIAKRSIRPAGASWLVSRTEEVTLTTGRRLSSITVSAGTVHVGLDDLTEREVDHVIMATGFHIDLSLLPWLSAELRDAIDCRQDGSPALGAGYESSVPGLHFIGATAAEDWGPLLRFVSGTGAAARELAGYISDQRPSRSSSRRGQHPVESGDSPETDQYRSTEKPL